MPTRYDIKFIARGFSFLEGPRWHEGRLYVSDFYTHRVVTFDEQGTMELVCRVPNQPSGLGFAPDESLRVVSMTDRRLLGLRDSELSEVADLGALATFHCNDLLVDREGRAYVGNFGWDLTQDPMIRSTGLILVQPDGTASIAAGEMVFPNGMVLTPDGKTLLVAETFAARISAFDVALDGSLDNRRAWATFSDRVFQSVPDAVAARVPLPDGMALDAEGALWIGDAAGSGALRVVEGGRIVDKVDTDDLTVFAVALGGSDRKTLYMCAAPPLPSEKLSLPGQSCLLSCRVAVAGCGLP